MAEILLIRRKTLSNQSSNANEEILAGNTDVDPDAL